MRRKRDIMTKEQHIEFGEQCKAFRRAIMRRHILNAGGKSCLASKKVLSALRKLDELRSAMDSLMLNTCDFDDDGYRHIYYGDC